METFKYNFILSLKSFGSIQVELVEKQISYTKKKLWLFSHDFSLPRPLRWLANMLKGTKKTLNAEKIIYFDISKGFLGTGVSTGYKAGGGTDTNLNLTLKKKEVEILKSYITENGGVIGAGLEGEKLKTMFPLLSPLKWLSFREIITIGKEGIGHTKKSWFKTRNSFMEYKSIKVFTHFGVISKKICLLGDVTISPAEGISVANLKRIKKILDEQSVITTKGKNYKPAILSGKRSFTSPSFLVTEEGVFCRSKSIGKSSIQYLAFNSINKFHKCTKKGHSIDYCNKGWKEIFAPIIIEGSRVDARTGEGGDVVMEVPGIAFYRWRTLFFFTGSLKRTLKSKT